MSDKKKIDDKNLENISGGITSSFMIENGVFQSSNTNTISNERSESAYSSLTTLRQAIYEQKSGESNMWLNDNVMNNGTQNSQLLNEENVDYFSNNNNNNKNSWVK